MAKRGEFQTLLDAVEANGDSDGLNVDGRDKIFLEISTSAGADGVLKIKGSIAADEPNWGSAKGVNNPWDNISSFDLQSGSGVTGDGGYTLGASDVRLVKVNAEAALRWIAVTLSGRTAGQVTVRVRPMELNR
jgi:hypothetical protein